MRIDLKKPARSIAIALDFLGPQPNHFDADTAMTEPMQAGGFIGDTQQGGSCNVDVIRMNPHCNGTHTESISHLVDDLIAPHEAIEQPILPAELFSVEPIKFDISTHKNNYQPASETGDLVIGLQQFTTVINSLHIDTKALIIRTLPNIKAKLSQQYNQNNQPPYFTNEVIQWLVDKTNVEHLLVDVPSIDRLQDDGLLSNHRIFWNIKPGSHQLKPSCWIHKTITEMIYVPDDIKDGRYVLSLQVPRMNLNAVPSNPILYTLKS